MLKVKQKIFFIFVFGLSCLCAMLICGCARKEIKNIDSKGKNIICFGDSLTFGYGTEPGNDYPSALAKLLDAPVINAGIDGDTSIEALRRLKPDVLDREPLLVIIEFCGNDFLRKIPKEVTVDNIRKMESGVRVPGTEHLIIETPKLF